MSSVYQTVPALVLGKRINRRLPEADQRRQRREVDEVIRRLRTQPGVILADEVGMGKTYVALARRSECRGGQVLVARCRRHGAGQPR